MKLSRIIKRFRIDHPQKFRLVDIDPGDICGLDIDKAEAKAIIAKSIQQLACRQDVLYATIAGRFSRSFRPWMRPGRTRRSSTSCRASIRKHARFSRSRRRAMRNWTTTFCGAPMSACPSAAASESSTRILLRGSAGGAGASGAAGASETSRQVVGKNIWQWRFQSINALEQHLARNRTRIVKFHLRISKEEQRKRFLDRLDEPGKRWKFSMDDIKERALWDKYMDAYEDMIRATSTPQAPWYVVVEVAVWRLETS